MKFKIIKRRFGVGLLLVVAASSSLAQKSTTSAETELRKVVENFRTSIIKKDKPLTRIEIFLAQTSPPYIR